MNPMPEYVAGRELDLLVRDRVFGPWDESRCRVCGWKIVPHGEQGCWTDNCSMRPAPERRADEPRPYSTGIAAAWEVIEKLGPKFWVRITSPFDRGEETHTGYWCGFTTLGMTGWNGRPDFEARADTAPLAICRAALAAVGSP